ncbi:MAG TPA: 2-amino-4-hydroxy-6-hydroxymethyldihydropteridine diphosphokinase [Acidobacteriota bacterium]|nr:2-amino-4-hydroxy-6-hydroxymethyldihydropteridine diphosphokinase [Acidobacteriota bacterium]
MARPATAFLSAGSNMGNRRENLERALTSLRRAGVKARRVSPFYETEPVGFEEQPWFLNLAVEVETSLDPFELLDACLAIESAQGRIRTFRNAPRTLDLDILLYGDLVISSPKLVIPHPRLEERRFVLAPLAQVAPDVMHPVLRKPIRSLLENCRDSSTVRVFSPGGPP